MLISTMYIHGKKINHRNPIKGFFITFSQSGTVTKLSFYDSFSSVFSVDKAIAVSELHKDGNPHIHLAVILKEGKTKSQVLSHFRGIYPDDYMRIDIQALATLKGSIQYFVSPEKDKYVDPEPIYVNCEYSQKPNRRHEFIHHQLRDRPIEERWNTCLCDFCTNEYFANRQIFGDEPIFVGDDEKVPLIYRN